MAKAGFTGEAWEGVCQERSDDGLVCLLAEGHGGKYHVEEGVGRWPSAAASTSTESETSDE